MADDLGKRDLVYGLLALELQLQSAYKRSEEILAKLVNEFPGLLEFLSELALQLDAEFHGR